MQPLPSRLLSKAQRSGCTDSNKAVIAIDQDTAGKQAKLVMQYEQTTPNPYDPSVQQVRQPSSPALDLDRRLAWPLLALTLSAAQVWLKGPLSNGDFAIAFVNTTNTSTAAAAAAAELGAAGGGGGLSLAACDATDPAQLWNISSSNGLLSIASGVRTDGSKQSPPHCVEVNGCNFVVGGKVDTSFGCKKPPQPGNKDKCA